jgi:hypothetical protein
MRASEGGSSILPLWGWEESGETPLLLSPASIRQLRHRPWSLRGMRGIGEVPMHARQRRWKRHLAALGSGRKRRDAASTLVSVHSAVAASDGGLCGRWGAGKGSMQARQRRWKRHLAALGREESGETPLLLSSASIRQLRHRTVVSARDEGDRGSADVDAAVKVDRGARFYLLRHPCLRTPLAMPPAPIQATAPLAGSPVSLAHCLKRARSTYRRFRAMSRRSTYQRRSATEANSSREAATC